MVHRPPSESDNEAADCSDLNDNFQRKDKSSMPIYDKLSQNKLSAASKSTQYVDQYLILSNNVIECFLLYALPLYRAVTLYYTCIFD